MVIAARRRSVVGGCALWITAAAAYVTLEAAAAAFVPDYSYGDNVISDLGTVDSPRAYLMNTAFYQQGLLFLGGAALLAHGLRARRRAPFLGFAAMNAVGNILVATVHGGPASTAGGPPWVHSAGAVLAIVGGNAAVLTGSQLVRHAGGPRWYRAVSIGVGTLGLLSLPVFLVGSDAAWERASVYTIIGWQMVTGCCLLAWTCAKKPQPGAGDR